MNCTETIINLKIDERVGDWTPPERFLIAEIHGVENKPKLIELDGAIYDETQIEYDESGKSLELRISDDGQAHEFKVSL